MFAILLISLILIPYSYSETKILNSTFSEIGKCDQIVGDFLLDLMMDMHGLQTIVKSKKIEECYGALKGESAKKLKNSYQFRYDKYEFYSHNLEYCTAFLFRDVDFMIQMCPEYAGYKSENITEKRKALNSARSCILNVMRLYCSTDSLTYLKSNFSRVVDYLTVIPENDNCESVQVDLQRGYVRNRRSTVMSRWLMFRDHIRLYEMLPDLAWYNEPCLGLMKYNKNKCNAFSTDDAMKKCEIYKAIGSEFYKCVRNRGKFNPIKFDFCNPNDKTCIKNSMVKYCGKSSITEFDKYFDWFNKYDVIKPDSIKLDNNDFAEYLQPKLENPISEDLEIGKCAPAVDELVSMLSRRNSFLFEKQSRIENKLCVKILKCYDSSKNDTLKTLYRGVCDKLEFETNNLFLLLESFYLDLHRQSKTFENSDYFSRNTTIKRKAFIDGKTIFLDMAQNRYGLGENYLNSKYEHFVDLITTKPEVDNYCNSIYSTVENYPCSARIINMADSLNTSTNWDSSLADSILEECRLFDKCMTGSRCRSEKDIKIINWCDGAKHGNVYFLSCLEKLRKEVPNFSNDHCAQKIAKWTETGVEYMELFGKNKECLKSVMLDECGGDAVANFDANYENVEENMNNFNEDY